MHRILAAIAGLHLLVCVAHAGALFEAAEIGDTATVNELLVAGISADERGALAEELAIGEFAIQDILDALTKPQRDPRDDLPRPVFRTGRLSDGPRRGEHAWPTVVRRSSPPS